jgi:periplasmic copper chaperone A
LRTFISPSIHRAIGAAAMLPAIALLAAPARAADYNAGPMQITQPWARATPKGASTGAAYMTIANKGTAADRVSCVADDASGQCQIHSMTMTGGVMEMRPVEGGLEIKPGETVTLKPGGYHVMFVNLTRPLVQGQAVKVTLKFEHAGAVDVDCPIAGIGAPAPGVAAGGGGMMMQGPGGAMSPPGGMSAPGGMQMNKP